MKCLRITLLLLASAVLVYAVMAGANVQTSRSVDPRTFARPASPGQVLATAESSTSPGPSTDEPPVDRSDMALAPNIIARDLGGKSWSLESERGKVVLLNFWATWCPPCREETPDLVHVANRYASKGLSVVGVSMDEGEADAIRRFVKEYKIPYAVVRPTAEHGLPIPVESLPTTLLIDRQGRVANAYVGAVSEATLKPEIEALLAQPGP